MATVGIRGTFFDFVDDPRKHIGNEQAAKYKDRNYAREGVKCFLDALLASGTTTCQAFTNSWPVSTEELFEEDARRNMRVIAGLTGIDRNAPADYVDTSENFYRDSKRLIAQYHNKGRNLYAVVYLWGYFISAPLIDRNGVPVWLSLFVGNLVSTQLLGWWLVPAAFRALDWWVTPKAAISRQIAGYALLAALYAASMGLYALLLAWHWGR